MSEPRVLHSDRWMSLTLDDATGIARYVRTEEPFASLAEIERCYEQLFAASWTMKRVKLLIDLRRAPPRNDESFESLARGYILKLRPRVSAVAWLVKTAAGKLQMSRMGADGGQRFDTFDDEAEALRFLASS